MLCFVLALLASCNDMNTHSLILQVTIPFGWNLVVDEDPAPILMLDIQGNVTFSQSKDITLTVSFALGSCNAAQRNVQMSSTIGCSPVNCPDTLLQVKHT